MILDAYARGEQMRYFEEPRWRAAITVSVDSGIYECKRDAVPFSPEQEVILDFKPFESSKFGNTSYSIGQVPGNYTWVSENEITESYKVLSDLAVQYEGAGFGLRFNWEQSEFLRWKAAIQASHQTLTLRYEVCGDGVPFGGGGTLNLSVQALVCGFLNSQQFQKNVVERHEDRLENRPPERTRNCEDLEVEVYSDGVVITGWRLTGPEEQIRELHRLRFKKRRLFAEEERMYERREYSQQTFELVDPFQPGYFEYFRYLRVDPVRDDSAIDGAKEIDLVSTGRIKVIKK